MEGGGGGVRDEKRGGGGGGGGGNYRGLREGGRFRTRVLVSCA